MKMMKGGKVMNPTDAHRNEELKRICMYISLIKEEVQYDEIIDFEEGKAGGKGAMTNCVLDVDDHTVPYELRSGFTFLKADEQDLDNALERAFKFHQGSYQGWDQLVQKDMNKDFSWKSCAEKFEELYRNAVGKAKRRSIYYT